ncbi:MAG: leucyl/phenylalanyl-tRNA--protein transferase [Planctomycetota bacterium]|jgi:leucyl/phenylalanyl-tRNA--protein transferase
MTIISKDHSSNNQLYWVADNLIASEFPDVSSALRDPDGLLAIGGDLSAERLLTAYQQGIFPWYSEGQPILWWSPDPRCVLIPENLKISRSLSKTIKKNIYQISFNKAFEKVIRACAEPRTNASGTWITDDMLHAYLELHEKGHAVSIECWHDEALVGGLYGIVIGKIFFGESMFSRMSDASKVALVHLTQTLKSHDFKLVDCQVHSSHLQSLGAIPMQRKLFISYLENFCCSSTFIEWPEQSL